MLAKEDEVSLVVEGDDAAAAVVGVCVEETGQHATHAVTQPRAEVVEDDLRPVAAHPTPALEHTMMMMLMMMTVQLYCAKRKTHDDDDDDDDDDCPLVLRQKKNTR